MKEDPVEQGSTSRGGVKMYLCKSLGNGVSMLAQVMKNSRLQTVFLCCVVLQNS